MCLFVRFVRSFVYLLDCLFVGVFAFLCAGVCVCVFSPVRAFCAGVVWSLMSPAVVTRKMRLVYGSIRVY